MKFIFDIVPLLGWAALWTAGGWMLAASLFRLRRRETAMVGLGIGLVLQTWLANLLEHPERLDRPVVPDLFVSSLESRPRAFG